MPFAVPSLTGAGLDPRKIKTVYPAVRYSSFLNRDANGSAVMNVGASLPKKSFEDFVALAASLPGTAFDLYPIGYGAAALAQLNEAHGHPVTLHTPVEPHAMPHVYKAHRWLVVTASRTIGTVGWPLCIAEAQASGVGVCVPSLRADLEEYVGEGGFFYDSLDEARDIISRPYPDDRREAGFDQARKSDIELHKTALTDLAHGCRRGVTSDAPGASVHGCDRRAGRKDGAPSRSIRGPFGCRRKPNQCGARGPNAARSRAAGVPVSGDVRRAGAESHAGCAPYFDLLRLAHARLEPRLYVEIGVRHGASLALARCRAVGVDPCSEITAQLGADVAVIPTTSDEFFALGAHASAVAAFDLAFIDGLHLFENALRDFINLEASASPTAVIAVDDALPCLPIQAERTRRTAVWTGDVWKLAGCLRRHRPDLLVYIADTRPTGTMIVAGLDPRSRVLDAAFGEIVGELSLDAQPPAGVLNREGAIAPTDSRLSFLFDGLRACRDANMAPRALIQGLRPAAVRAGG